MPPTTFHIGIMGNLFSGKTTLLNALSEPTYRNELTSLLGDGIEFYSFSERVEQGSLADRCLNLFYQDRVQNIFPTEVAFLYMRAQQQREIRHLMTRETGRGVLIMEDRPFLDGPEVFVKRMIASGEMPRAHADLYRTLLYRVLQTEHIRFPDLFVYLRSESDRLEHRRQKRAGEGDGYAQSITSSYLKEIHECYEDLVMHFREILNQYREYAIIPPDTDVLVLPAEIDMYEHPDYVHVAVGTIREKIRRMVKGRKNAS